MIKRLIKQYITCKHKDFDVIRSIFHDMKYNKAVHFDRRKCKDCGREFYSDYYVEDEYDESGRFYFKD